MKFRKKPVIVEAKQYLGKQPWPPGVVACGSNQPETYWGDCYEDWPHVHTLEGLLRVAPGDWIVCGVKGEYYPVKPDIFILSYEPAKD